MSLQHANAHPTEFAIWARPVSTPINDQSELSDSGSFSGWVTAGTPFSMTTVSLNLPGPAAEAMDVYIATRVTAAPDSHFCHAYWHEFAVLSKRDRRLPLPAPTAGA